MAETYVYAVLCAPCLPQEYEDKDEEAVRKNLTVVMRFDSEEQLNDEADNFFDNVYGSFQRGLDLMYDYWYVDDSPEIQKLISKEEAKKIGYVIFVSD